MSNNPQSFHSLRELFNALRLAHNPRESIAPLIPLVEKYVGTDWRSHRVFHNRKYNRIPLTHLKSSDIEFVIITWKKGQSAPLHNHPEHGCIVKVLQGNLTEFLYDFRRELKNIQHSGVNSVTYMDDTIGLHEVVATEDTVSLHIYSPPNYTPAFFR